MNCFSASWGASQFNRYAPLQHAEGIIWGLVTHTRSNIMFEEFLKKMLVEPTLKDYWLCRRNKIRATWRLEKPIGVPIKEDWFDRTPQQIDKLTDRLAQAGISIKLKEDV